MHHDIAAKYAVIQQTREIMLEQKSLTRVEDRGSAWDTAVCRTKILHGYGLTQSWSDLHGAKSPNTQAIPQDVWPKGS